MIKINVSNVDDFSFTFTILNGGPPGGMALYIYIAFKNMFFHKAQIL